MSCVYKIKEGLGSFTDTDQKLAEYTLANREEVVMLSAKELAQRVNSSAAAVVRFSKRIGYKGFTELKVELAKDKEEKEDEFNAIIKENDSIDSMVKKAESINLRAMERTYKLINKKVLERAIKSLNECENIYLFGIGASGLVAQDFQYKLSRINKMAIYQVDEHIQVASAVHIGPNDVAIGISYSGESKGVNVSLTRARNQGAKTIAITSFNKNSLSKIVELPLYIPSEETELRIGAITSRISELLITDLLYLGIAKDDFQKTEEYIIKTKEIVKKIR
ncbi:MurR/RpiR family transcriptional regulator [Clostridium vincentii]|uniref:Putative HTH-type transcriptional regulator YbbH n=1 Tax=Clostridium vincentii TaxID=52704 RepID=A0A2T0BKQ4_9CLOT|nr:MurR/RpiR family transcriptional regulator [Clostridium vincentii]PRR84413.1 putative HTH-type transcriptional regulator YbbH [Clostridium vincentii]